MAAVLALALVAAFLLRQPGSEADAASPPGTLVQEFSGIINVKIGQTTAIARPVTVTVTSVPRLGSTTGYNGSITEVILDTDAIPVQGDLSIDTRTSGWTRTVGVTSRFTLNTPSSAAGEVWVAGAWRTLKRTAGITTVTARFTNDGASLQLNVSGQVNIGMLVLAVEASTPATTGLDSAPQLVGITPADGSANNSTSTNIVFTFSEPVIAPPAAFSLICGGTPVPFAVIDLPGNDEVTLDPDGPLPSGEAGCTATVDMTEVQDEDLVDPPNTGTGTGSTTFTFDAAPGVLTTMPNALSPSQAADTDIVVTFTEPVTVDATSFTLDCGSGSIPFVLSGSGTVSVTLNPVAPLPNGATCNLLVVAANVTDIDVLDPPDQMASDYSTQFLIDAQPSLVSTSPTNSAVVASDRSIQLTFSEPITLDANAFTVVCSANPQVMTQSVAGNVVTIAAPVGGWPVGSACQLSGDSTRIHDADTADPPDTLAANVALAFSIDAAPSVTSTVPVNGTMSYPVTGNITINFSEAVNVSADAVELSCDSSPVAFTGLPATNVTQVVLDPVPAALGLSCTFTVFANEVSDADAIDPPDHMAADVTVSFLTDVPPTAVPDSATVPEDATATAVNVLANDVDPDGGPISIVSVTQPGNGTVVITGGGTGLTYEPNANYCNTPPGTTLDTFTYTLTPGGSSTTVSVTVTCVDDAPVAVDDAETVDEDSGATAVDVLANDTDIDGGSKSVVSVTQPTNGTVVITGGGSGLTYEPDANYCNTPPGTTLDTFAYTLTPGSSSATVTMSVNCLPDDPEAIDDAETVVEDATATAVDVLGNDSDPDSLGMTITSVTQPANGTVVITGGGTGVTYEPSANYCNMPPGTTLDTFTYTLTPGGSVGTVSMTVTCVDDAPVAVNNSATVDEDAAATAVDVLANDTDLDGGPISIASVTQPANGTVVITGGGMGLTYEPNDNYCNTPPGTTLDTFTYTLTPGSSSATVTMTVTCINDAPTLVDNTIEYTVLGNTQLRVGELTPGFSLLHLRDNTDVLETAQPADVDGPGPLQVVPMTTNTGNGDLVLNADGTLTYEPNAGFTGSDVVNIQITDSATPTPGLASATITFNVSETVWYVNNTVGANNPAAGDDGRSTNAFEVIGDVEPVVTDNDYIFVFEGDTATTPLNGGVDIDNSGVKLLGEGVGLTIPGFGSLIPAGNQPRLTNLGAPGGPEDNGVNITASSGTLAGVEVRGLNVTGRDNGINVDITGTAPASITISQNTIGSDPTTGLEGLDVNAGSTGEMTLAVHDNVVNARGNGLDIARSAGELTITAFDDNTVSGDNGGSGIVVSGPVAFDATPGGALDPVDAGTTTIGASANPVTGAGMTLTSVTGAVDFDDLDVYAGTSAVTFSGLGSFTGATGARISVAQNVSTIQAANGPGVNISNATADLRLSSLTVSASPTTGVSLSSVTDGTTPAFFSAGAGSSIANTVGTAFNVDSGNATVTYGGSITNSSGRSVAIQNRTGDAVTFLSGSTVTDSGTGILVNANAAATTDFLGSLTLTTGVNAAFTATSGGTLRVSGAANAITTTTGTALTVTNTTIATAGAAPESGLRFRSISAGTGASGPANGIVLNNTGAIGSLTVTGTGSAGSGGTIQRTTSHGISLTSTLGPSFTNVNISQTGGSGVKGTTVTNFTFVNGSITNSGTALGVDESNIAFNTTSSGTENNLSGTVTITGNTLTNAYYHGVDIFNHNGTISDVNISNNTITSTNSTASSKGSGIRLVAFGSATTVANVTKATISNNIVSNFPSGAGIQAQGGNANASGSPGTFGVLGSGTNIISITSNRVAGESSGNKMGTNAILAVVNGKGQGNFDISNNGTVGNPITNIAGNVISHSVFGQSTVTSTISNNVIVANHQANFGGPLGISTGVDNVFALTDAPNLTVTITGNTISQTDGNGILAAARNSNGTLKAKIQNNTVAAPLGGVRPGIRIDSGSASGNTTVCLNISGNTSAGSGGSQGLGLRKQGTVSTTNAFGINGMAATSSPGVEAYVDGLNPAGNGTLLISATSGFTNCSLP